MILGIARPLCAFVDSFGFSDSSFDFMIDQEEGHGHQLVL